MIKKGLAVLLFAVCGLFVFTNVGCVPVVYYHQSIPCTPDTPGVEKMMVRFVCPYVGASYETEALKCPGDDHFRIDVVCKLCGRRHHDNIRYWPEDYRVDGYYLYYGWFYPYDWWDRYGPYYGYRGYRPHTIIPHSRLLPHPQRYPNKNLRNPREIQPPSLPRMQNSHGQTSHHNSLPPQPPPQRGQSSPPSRHK